MFHVVVAAAHRAKEERKSKDTIPLPPRASTLRPSQKSDRRRYRPLRRAA